MVPPERTTTAHARHATLFGATMRRMASLEGAFIGYMLDQVLDAFMSEARSDAIVAKAKLPARFSNVIASPAVSNRT